MQQKHSPPLCYGLLLEVSPEGFCFSYLSCLCPLESVHIFSLLYCRAKGVDSRKTLVGELIIIILISGLCLPRGQRYAKTPGSTTLSSQSSDLSASAIHWEGNRGRGRGKWPAWGQEMVALGLESDLSRDPDSPQGVRVCIYAKYAWISFPFGNFLWPLILSPHLALPFSLPFKIWPKCEWQWGIKQLMKEKKKILWQWLLPWKVALWVSLTASGLGRKH